MHLLICLALSFFFLLLMGVMGGCGRVRVREPTIFFLGWEAVVFFLGREPVFFLLGWESTIFFLWCSLLRLQYGGQLLSRLYNWTEAPLTEPTHPILLHHFRNNLPLFSRLQRPGHIATSSWHVSDASNKTESKTIRPWNTFIFLE